MADDGKHEEEVHHLLGKDFFSPNSIPLRILRRNPQMPYPLHTHDFMEMVVVTSGTGTHTSPQGNLPIGRGAVFVIRGNTAHGYKDLNQLCLINILFDLESQAVPLFDLGQSPGFHSLFTIDPVTRFQDIEKSTFSVDDSELATLVELIDSMDRSLEAGGTGPKFLAMTWFMRVVHFVSQAYDQRHAANPGPLPYRLGAALSHVESDLSARISIEELCAISGMSESSLLRAFRSITGHPPIKYQHLKRIEKACWYLQYTNYTMGEISEALGYNDSNYFSRQFHQVQGLSPRDYRRRAGSRVASNGSRKSSADFPSDVEIDAANSSPG